MVTRRGILLASVVAMAISLPTFAEEHTTDSLDVVKAQMANGQAVLLDVREPEETNEGTIAGAKILPFRTKIQPGVTKEELTKLVPEGKVIYTHCKMGRRALGAAIALKKLGYDVRALKPGYDELLKEGFEKAKKE